MAPHTSEQFPLNISVVKTQMNLTDMAVSILTDPSVSSKRRRGREISERTYSNMSPSPPPRWCRYEDQNQTQNLGTLKQCRSEVPPSITAGVTTKEGGDPSIHDRRQRR